MALHMLKKNLKSSSIDTNSADFNTRIVIIPVAVELLPLPPRPSYGLYLRYVMLILQLNVKPSAAKQILHYQIDSVTYRLHAAYVPPVSALCHAL
jgi:hypothetical protein